MAINILIFLLIIILILIIVNIILISAQTKNIYGGAGPEDLISANTVESTVESTVNNTELFTRLNAYLNELSEKETNRLDTEKTIQLLENDVLMLEPKMSEINEETEKKFANSNDEDSDDGNSEVNIDVEVLNTMEGKTNQVYYELLDRLNHEDGPIDVEYMLKKYHSLNLLHYNFVEILKRIMDILYKRDQKQILLECAARYGIISAFIAYTLNNEENIKIIATDPKPKNYIEDSKYYYPIEHQKTLLKSIEDYPSQIVLISRGDDTFMNGKFVKSWIGQNVGKVIVLVIIDYKFSNQKLRNILINNEFSEHNLQYFGLLFDYDRISDVTIYVKNVQNANYVDITDEEDLTITDDDKYVYTERGNINSCRSIITRGSPNSNIASTPNSNIASVSSTRSTKKNRDNCKVKCSIMG
jgi:hypothetical protein